MAMATRAGMRAAACARAACARLFAPEGLAAPAMASSARTAAAGAPAKAMTQGWTGAPFACRPLSGTPAPRAEGEGVGQEAFLPAFEKAAPSGLDPPMFQGDFASPKPAAGEEGAAAAAIPEKVTFSLQLPHEALYSREEVDMVLAPATTGDFGVLPGHVPTVAQLKPGVLQVHKTRDTDVVNYFVSGGFAFVHPNGQADVIAQECVLLEDLDPEMVKQGLAEYTSKASSAADDYERAAAQVGVEVYSAMQSAIEKAG